MFSDELLLSLERQKIRMSFPSQPHTQGEACIYIEQRDSETFIPSSIGYCMWHILFMIPGFVVIADIMNKKPQLAWKLYLKMETSGESINLLQLIANDCYKVSLSLIIKKK